MGPILQTLRQMLRRFGRAPMFTAVALLTLAIGIGANTAIFSVVNGVLIKPLPYPDPGRLISTWHAAPGIPDFPGDINLSPTMYFTYKEQNQSFTNLGAWNNGGVSVTGAGDPEQIRSLWVTHGVLDALGVPPILGRWFTKDDDTPGTAETVILTYGYWQRKFGGDRSILGRGINVDSRPREIVGVMPEDFRFLNQTPEIILPQRFDRNRIFLGNFSFQGIARLKPGATFASASADIGRLLPIWISAWPTPPGFNRDLFVNARLSPKLHELKQDVVGDVGTVLWVLMGTIGMVLLIACANVANLLLVRAEGRQQELAVRAALGAGWGRIARELLGESLVLGLIGGAFGLALAYGSLRLLISIGPATLPRLNEISIDPLVLAFAAGASLLSGLLFGSIPVLKYAGPQIAGALRGGGRTSSGSRERHRARNVLVVVQVALAMVLLVGSGLMIRTFQALRSVHPGFANAAELQTMRITIPNAQVREPENVARMQQAILEKLAAIPGVSSTALISGLPMEGFNSNDVLYAEDKVYTPGQIPPIRRFKFIAPGAFQTMGTPLVAGRDLTWTDLYDQRMVTMISESLAREMWGDPRAALGKRIREGMNDPWREVVGVVGDVRDNGVHEKVTPIVYWPVLMKTFWGDDVRIQRSATFVIRSPQAGTEAFLTQVRQAVWSVNASLPLALVRTLDDVYRQSMARTSFTLVMLAIAGSMALLLGVIGIYGVISYAVSQRTREIGIRLALGAQLRELKGMFVRYALILAGIGVAIGLGAAAGLTRLMKTLLFETSPLDPLTYVAVAVVLAGAAVLASYLPARRATTVDPVEALRAE